VILVRWLIDLSTTYPQKSALFFGLTIDDTPIINYITNVINDNTQQRGTEL